MGYELKIYPTNKRLHGIFSAMKQRCYNAATPSYKNYGGRGIEVYDLWRIPKYGYWLFVDWAMQNGYEDHLTLDRIDVNGNYEPLNCRWVDMTTQANNKRNNVYVEVKGTRLTVTQWARRTGRTPAQMRKTIQDTFGRDILG